MLRLVIVVSILSLVSGLINIESQPRKVANNDFVKLTCNVGTMKNTVKWVYGGVTYFSCDPPYTNSYCYTNINDTINYFYDFSIKDDSLIMILQVRQNQNDGIWSCYHGKEKQNFKMDIKDRARVTSFSSIKDKPGEYKFQCNVESQIPPVDVSIYAVSYQGERILYNVKQTNQSMHSVSPTIRCSEINYYCNVTNGYGTASSSRNVYVECPLKILYNLLPNRKFNLDDFRVSGRITILYYEGYPSPSISVYRIGADDIPQYSLGIYLTYSNPTRTKPAYVFVYNINYDTVKTGKYMLVLKQGNVKEVVYFNLIFSTSSTTVLPTETSTIDPGTTTEHQAPATNTTASENVMNMTYDMDAESTIMDYLGVAAFVMFLMLILILVIVGVFWFIRMKRKPAASVDQNEIYSTMQTPSSRPNPIYENLNKP